MASNVVEKKRRYEGQELLDEFLLNQVAKEVNVFKLSLFAKDLGIPQTEYNKITSPNTFTKDEQIQRSRITSQNTFTQDEQIHHISRITSQNTCTLGYEECTDANYKLKYEIKNTI